MSEPNKKRVHVVCSQVVTEAFDRMLKDLGLEPSYEAPVTPQYMNSSIAETFFGASLRAWEESATLIVDLEYARQWFELGPVLGYMMARGRSLIGYHSQGGLQQDFRVRESMFIVKDMTALRMALSSLYCLTAQAKEGGNMSGSEIHECPHCKTDLKHRLQALREAVIDYIHYYGLEHEHHCPAASSKLTKDGWKDYGDLSEVLGAMWVDPADHEVALVDAVEEANKSAEVNEEDARKDGFAEGKEAGKTEGYNEGHADGLVHGADQERAKLADADSKFTPTDKKTFNLTLVEERRSAQHELLQKLQAVMGLPAKGLRKNVQQVIVDLLRQINEE